MIDIYKGDKLSENNLGREESIARNIILFFVSNGDYLTEIRLQKLFYATEIEYIHKYGKRLSNVDFINHKHGMYSFDIKYILDKLEDEGKITTVFKKTKDGYDGQFFHPNKKEIIIDLDDNRIKFLNSIINKFAFVITQEIINFAKSTKPFRITPYGDQIDLDKYAEDCFINSLVNDKRIVSQVIESENEYKKGVFTKFGSHDNLLKYLDRI